MTGASPDAAPGSAGETDLDTAGDCDGGGTRYPLPGERLAAVEAEIGALKREIAGLRRLAADERRAASEFRAAIRESLRIVQDYITRETAGRRAIARVARLAFALLAAGGAAVAIWKGLGVRQ